MSDSIPHDAHTYGGDGAAGNVHTVTQRLGPHLFWVKVILPSQITRARSLVLSASNHAIIQDLCSKLVCTGIQQGAGSCGEEPHSPILGRGMLQALEAVCCGLGQGSLSVCIGLMALQV